MTYKKVEIFVDGACRSNPGPGGWGVLLRYNHHEKKLSGALKNTTNNRMELVAAIMGLSALKSRCKVDVTTDSQYVRNGITKWLAKWEKNQWHTSAKKPVKNLDLWKKLHALTLLHEVKWHWVRGHSGHRENEIVDKLARNAIDDLLTGKIE
jgi:ribonuclease HI